jgi:hypothetical protein
MPEISERVDIEMLADAARGTAYVSALSVQGETTLVRLAYPHGRAVDVVLPVTPGADPTMVVERPLAVQVTGSRDGLHCSVLHTSVGGPLRQDISLQHALAFTDAGVHTVFRTT